MELYSLAFVTFLVLLLALYYAAAHFAPKLQWLVLLVGSLAFYEFAGGTSALILIALNAGIAWCSALLLEHLDQRARHMRKEASGREERKVIKANFARKRRALFWVSLVALLASLFVFKYAHAILQTVGRFSPLHGLILPLGISFYCFQALGYLIDVYNNTAPAEKNYLRFLLFVSWFPQLLQGPINRWNALSGPLFATHHAREIDFSRAALRIGWGMLKKYALADMVDLIVAPLFAGLTTSTPGSVAAVAVVLYSVQDYADFAGGIDMVCGVSELFGIPLAQNFAQPYLATSLADFWRRWHMSLGAWVRDYVFYPLALTRPMQAIGKWARAKLPGQLGRTLVAGISNVIVFLIVGVWHGPQLHFVLWGLYNGLVIAVADVVGPSVACLRDASHVRVGSPLWRALAVAKSFALINFGRYFDRIADVRVAWACLVHTFTRFDVGSLAPWIASLGLKSQDLIGLGIAASVCVVVIAADVLTERGHDLRSDVLSLKPLVRLALYGACGLVIVLSFVVSGSGRGFMYANY